MVFVTVGNARQGFRRLLDAVDDLAGSGLFEEEQVVVQSGHSNDYRPKHCMNSLFIGADEFERSMREANLIICHGGCGTQLMAIRFGKTPVVMPRLRRYGEHVNDHQLQLVEALSQEGLIIPAYEPDDLPRAIAEARLRATSPLSPNPSPMLSLVAKAVEELLHRER